MEREIKDLAGVMKARFSPPQYIPGCNVESIADKDEYTTNNGWIEAFCGQHNQQRVRYIGKPASVAVNDTIDVLYFQDTGLFSVYDVGGTAVAPVATSDDFETFVAKNTSGATASANDVGYIDSAGEYKTTTTANLDAEWCVVIQGAANNSDIYVAKRGRVTVAYTGSAPSAGDYLVTSTSAGDAQQQTTMRPEVFAVCTANGAGGTVSALLLTQTRPVKATNANNVIAVSGSSQSDFQSTINGAPTSTTVVYGTVTSGAENVINVASSSQLGKMVLHNTTRGTSRLISSVVTGTNTITTVSSTDSWADTDAIEIRSQTVDPGGAPYMIDIDLSQSTSAIPATARSILLDVSNSDTGAAGRFFGTHPFETYGASKQVLQYSRTLGTNRAYRTIAVSLLQSRFCIRVDASGAGTAFYTVRLMGYDVAGP